MFFYIYWHSQFDFKIFEFLFNENFNLGTLTQGSKVPIVPSLITTKLSGHCYERGPILPRCKLALALGYQVVFNLFFRIKSDVEKCWKLIFIEKIENHFGTVDKRRGPLTKFGSPRRSFFTFGFCNPLRLLEDWNSIAPIVSITEWQIAPSNQLFDKSCCTHTHTQPVCYCRDIR